MHTSALTKPLKRGERISAMATTFAVGTSPQNFTTNMIDGSQNNMCQYGDGLIAFLTPTHRITTCIPGGSIQPREYYTTSARLFESLRED